MLLRTLKFFDDQSRMQYSFIQSSVVLFVISYQLWEIIGLVNLFGTGVTGNSLLQRHHLLYL